MSRANAIRSAALVAATALLVLGAGSASASTAGKLRLGTLTLHRCGGGLNGYCGSLARPLDPARPHGERVSIGFRWLPASRRDAGHPALVAVEGGPGYPSAGSMYEYHGIYRPLLHTRNLLLVDNRGTGRSGLIDCKPLQSFTGTTTGTAFTRMVAGCARQIDRAHSATKSANDLFATAYAANDLAAVLRALRLGRVDMYGDSYGTWFVQSFMARHRSQLHSVILDSAYPVRDLDPWYGSSAVTARAAMDAVCARDAGCASAAPGSATARLGALVARLRAAPVTGSTRDADGSRVRARVDVRAVADMVQDAGSDPVIYRELDASARAALAGDPAPLLRLAAQARTYDHSPSPADYFSNGLYMAVSCADYPQLFSMRATPAQRRARLQARIASGPVVFAPFTIPEWLQIGAYSQPYTACLDWPSPTHDAPAIPAHDTPLPASIPILIVGGDIDSLTPLSDAQVFGPKLGANVRVVTLSNTVHVTSEGDTMLTAGASCGRRIMREFVRAPQRLQRIDATCADRIPPVHTPGAYPATLAAAGAATLVSGTDPGPLARRAATVAAGALADASIRRVYSGADKGPGLRGGTFTAKGYGPVALRLRGVRFVADATIDGSATWRPGTGGFTGDLTVRPASGSAVTVHVTWDQRSTAARATVAGAVLSLPAP